EGIHGISGSEIGERRATARHPGNTAIVHFFAGRDVPGSAWEEPERDEHQLVQGAAHPRYAIRTRPAFIRTQRVLLQRAGSCRSTALGANRSQHIFAPGAGAPTTASFL